MYRDLQTLSVKKTAKHAYLNCHSKVFNHSNPLVFTLSILSIQSLSHRHLKNRGVMTL